MDILWERSIDFYPVEKRIVREIIREFDKGCTVQEIQPISMGCRNSNYTVTTDRRKMLLRICPPDGDSSAKEILLFNELSGSVRMPEIFHVSTMNSTGRVCLLYEFIDGVPLNKMISANGGATDELVMQAAQYSAFIHRCSKSLGSEFHAFELPPFFIWYDVFLNSSRTQERLGEALTKHVRSFMQRKANDLLVEIDALQSLTHGDYRPANMLIDGKGRITVVDWEYAGYGHTLADIGQFFRYRQFYSNKHRRLFKREYDSIADKRLPENWYSLSRIRDLINPLQMLDAENDAQIKYQDLISVILDIINEDDDAVRS